ncbi:DUF2062 domain-containing protein [Mucilaginibacter sp. SP1R1]|uniref:DUF2062 domain-containing protein n=1 Tax=Mucilaginibacter sp. SP1R1 TaxID=2723091 RepID=UPI001609B912|nr:DUF2062 domain-containing protein [Mucilaginibacter sp. SP1R1]MBB6151697.1 uncharacterized protein (DUF2062 family) [Mucilaginibacter sp. SP1R1]
MDNTEKIKSKFQVLNSRIAHFFKTLFSKEKSKQFIKNQLFNPEHSVRLKASSIGFGVFMGIVPIWGFQLIVAFALAVLFKLNKALVILAAHISFAPMIPVIIFLSYKVGGYWMGNKNTDIHFADNISIKTVGQHLEQYLYGSISLAIIAGITAGLLTLVLLNWFKRNPQQHNETISQQQQPA